jgi:oligopeptidase B
MEKKYWTSAMLAAAICTSLSFARPGAHLPKPPEAAIARMSDTLFSDIRSDDYRWLRQREDPEVIRYLNSENQYAETVMAPTRALQETLYQEMRGRIKETDLTVPEKMGSYFYYYRTEQGRQYSLFCRKKDRRAAGEEIVFDENAAAHGHQYFDIGSYRISPDHKMLAYTLDTTGSEYYSLHIKHIAKGRVLADSIARVDNSLEWGNDAKTLFYLTLDESHRPYRLYRHVLGTSQSGDDLLYQEDDPKYSLELFKTRSRKYIVLHISSKSTAEERYIEADKPRSGLKILSPRRPGIEYYLEHQGGYFYVLTNQNAVNFKLLRSSTQDGGVWQEVIAPSDSVLLEGVDAFKDFMAVYERRNGLKNIRIIDSKNGTEHYVEFPEPDYSFWPSRNWEYDSYKLRFSYTSFVTPRTVYDYDVKKRAKETLKRQEVLGGYNQDDYRCERIFARAGDGVLIPVSLVYKKGLATDGKSPLVLEGYGAYGASSNSYFSSARLSLLDRGFIYAIAHVRGGGEMGRRWYDQGKLLNKKNSFTDFIACAEYLISQKYSSPDKLVITGGSAGGLLMGAVANMRPDLFKGVVANVPFVDVINTMLDPSIPLTTAEYEEWGNPGDPAYYFYMKSYSPYDNVKRQNYPNMLITAGLNDPRVGFWEPAKWTAKLRALKTDNNLLLLKTNMAAGHGGLTGRFDYLKEEAFEYAFILGLFGIRK